MLIAYNRKFVMAVQFYLIRQKMPFYYYFEADFFLFCCSFSTNNTIYYIIQASKLSIRVAQLSYLLSQAVSYCCKNKKISSTNEFTVRYYMYQDIHIELKIIPAILHFYRLNNFLQWCFYMYYIPFFFIILFKEKKHKSSKGLKLKYFI